ncbi:MAG: DUF1549 and DUF1553 domain-containing protein, partial [Prosthecobacter sp.]|nr:DUF1549 and DUF1553 domain-containing protein [Prosthecobacter sp.]
HRISTTEPDDVMPPPSSPKQLTKAERELFRRWIAEGAEYQDHWAFVPIKRPSVPVLKFQVSGFRSSPKQLETLNLKPETPPNPIDAFIEEKLRPHGLKPAAEAAPITLIRRVFLDLTGLPPTSSDLSGLSDWSDEKYAALVDRLLASPNFGERWARHWLDMARYADSNGFLGDGLRPNAWRYRDWVIDAINRDLPFDQFTIEQIAGDLLPEPTLAQLTASGFHRNAALNTEAGVDKEEARFQNLADRVNTTGRVWMGLTVGCAQCHTHKYDPITIRDYYSFYAFFNNTADLDEPQTKAPALAEVMKDRRQTYVHMAGDYTRRGPDVMPASLSALPPMTKPAQPEPSRLDLAKWLVSPQHPLTSRVSVNHIWSKLFGIGLVSTPDDFGATGEPPSHPELLDWLASEFMRQGWSRKQLIKLIVTSATYKQSSTHREDIVVLDPLNRLLSRQNRLRLDAEILRDSVLAVSGLLKPTIGGPSFRPPLPEDVFDVGRSSNWKASPGDEIYRRSLYIITLRSVLYPMLTTFDAPDAADACVRRERSNTPLQALTMMNDGVFVEAAQSLALRVLHQSPAETPKRLQKLFHLVLNREPCAEELSRLQAFHTEQKARVQKGGVESLKALGTHEKAVSPSESLEATALVATARVLMNLDEFINRQ